MASQNRFRVWRRVRADPTFTAERSPSLEKEHLLDRSVARSEDEPTTDIDRALGSAIPEPSAQADARDWTFRRPIFKSPDFIQSARIPEPTAMRVLSVLSKKGVLRRLAIGRGRAGPVFL